MGASARFPLPPDGPPHDLLYSANLPDGVRAFLDGHSATVDLETALPGSKAVWVRVTPSHTRPNRVNNEMWHFDGTCQLLDDDFQPTGPMGTCNGWVSVVVNPQAVAGKLNMYFPS